MRDPKLSKRDINPIYSKEDLQLTAPLSTTSASYHNNTIKHIYIYFILCVKIDISNEHKFVNYLNLSIKI